MSNSDMSYIRKVNRKDSNESMPPICGLALTSQKLKARNYFSELFGDDRIRWHSRNFLTSCKYES